LNFAVFSIPGSNEFEILVENQELKNNESNGFIFHPFKVESNTPSVFIPADIHLKSDELNTSSLGAIEAIPSLSKPTSTEEPFSITKENYIAELANGISEMEIKKVDKFIYSRTQLIEKHDNLDLSKYLLSLNKSLPNAYNYLFHHHDSGTWMGATPETLVSWNGGPISTMSLAGTQPISNGIPQWKIKEKEEQAYVTKYLENSFREAKIPYKTGPTSTLQAGPVFHLKTEIHSKDKVSYNQAMELVNSLHPTPAICGVPLKKAFALINKVEKHSRKYYTGYLGYIEPNKKVNLFVNLRCLQVLTKDLALYIGGGITKKSIPEKEWDETVFKSKTLINALPKS
jgi:isochorismate synthase